MSKLHLPVSFAQTVINNISLTNKYLQRVELAAIRVGKNNPEIAVATDLRQVGQPAHVSCLSTIQDGTVVYRESSDAIEVVMPIKDVDGEIMAAARIFLKPGKLTTKATHRARATAVAIELGKKIQTHAGIFR